MTLVDTHCHLHHPAFDSDREIVLDRALNALEWLVVIGDDVPTSQAGVAFARERVYATVGIHPHSADHADAQTLEAIRELLAQSQVVAIGEIGLDYHYHFSSRENQRKALERQLTMAAELRRPVVIHCREAEADVTAAIDPLHASLVGGVMHCFGGTPAFAERCLSWGFHISFAGNVTFPKATALQDAARVTPMDRLLVETDSPYLAPQPVRGKRCEPVYVRYTARFLAELKQVPEKELASQTSANARRLFGIPG
jgi:TatD DNase family protein